MSFINKIVMKITYATAFLSIILCDVFNIDNIRLLVAARGCTGDTDLTGLQSTKEKKETFYKRETFKQISLQVLRKTFPEKNRYWLPVTNKNYI